MTKKVPRLLAVLSATVGSLVSSTSAQAAAKVGEPAPQVRLKTHEGEAFDLAQRKGRWTVLYFYPKADTPGCTKQACAFRDSIKKIRALDAEVYGVSADEVAELKAFHQKHHLNFPLLADPDATVIEAFGAKMPVMKMAKRWTFIIGPDLTVRNIQEGVDPVKDADRVAQVITSLQK